MNCPFKKLFSLMVIITLLSGCWNAKEVDRMYYAHVIGVDYKDERYEVYVKLIDFSSIGKGGNGGGGGGDGDQAKVGKGMGKTIDTAFHELYQSTDLNIYFGHLASFVFTPEAIEQGFYETLDLFSRYNETPYTVWLFATDSPLKDVLTTFPALKSFNMFTKLSDPTDTYSQSSIVKPMKMHEFYREVNEPGSIVGIPKVTASEKEWSGADKTEKGLIVNGLMLIDKNGFRTVLSEEEMKGRRWFNKKIERIPTLIAEDDDPIAVLICREVEMEIIPIINGDEVTFKIKMTAEAGDIQKIEEISEHDLEKKGNEIIKKQIQNTYEFGLDEEVDVYNLSYQLYRKNPDKWKELTNDKGELPLTEDSLEEIEVHINMVDSGLKQFKKVE